MTAIEQAFQNQKQQGNAALVGYIMAGDPKPEATPQIADALIRGGIDVLELGLPFSDPIADGPTIQAASIRALAAKTTPIQVLTIAKQLKQQHDIPIVIMTYFNPVFRIGVEKFCESAKDCKVDGLIIPDLPVEEADEYKHAAKNQELDTIFIAAPSTSSQRLKKIIAASTGFLYLVSHFGVTGTQTNLQDSTVQLINRVSAFTTGKIPLAVGFGISNPRHIQKIVQAGADGAIVGSAFINIIQKNTKNTATMLEQLRFKAASLKSATKKPT
jgi:tryptophan synthase alpha chain